MSVLLKLARWLLTKFSGALLIVLLGLAAYGLWIFLSDNIDVDRQRAEEMKRLLTDRERLEQVKGEIEARIAKFKADVALQQERVTRAKKIIATLRELESWWDRWFGNRSQQTANVERLKRMEQVKSDSERMITDLARQIAHTGWEKDGAELALHRVETDIRRLEGSKSTAAHYFRRAWDRGKWYVASALAAYFFGPTLWALAMYFGFAAVAMRGRPIRFTDQLPALPAVGESHVSIVVSLREGELLRIKEKFLQASDEGVKKSTRFVLDWRVPLTSLACGLVELVELRAAAVGTEYRVTLSNSDDPHIELALVEIPAGGALILRPSYLAGVVQREDEPLRIRRRWQIFRWQAWITGQFRFFEFIGPCRLVVAGSRGVRAEVLAEREGVSDPARRTNQDATIGFTPNLDYRPVRAETFWSYYRGMNPLFDDLFAGRGLFILQETATPGAAAKTGRFWSAVWNGVLKVFGV
ncbi:MAG: hypothetical protein ABIZ49_10310 [Opitutaceae bacterium]